MRYPISSRIPARTLLVALTLAPVLIACASVERTVTSVTAFEGGRVTWESNRYPNHRAEDVGAECSSQAVRGEPVPEACLTGPDLAAETDPWKQAPWIAGLGTAVAIPLLLLVTWRRVGWQPEVAGTRLVPTPPPHFDEDGALVLMRSAGTERAARIEAERERRDPSHPVLAGVALALAVLTLLSLVFGYGRAIGWGLVTGMLLLLGGGIPASLITLNLLHPPNLDAAIGRIRFLTGVTTVLVFGSFVGSYLRAPLLGLNGIAWPF